MIIPVIILLFAILFPGVFRAVLALAGIALILVVFEVVVR